jgi:hypothetical protein
MIRCDPKAKCKMAKLYNKMIDNSVPFLDKLFWQYLCFAKYFWSLVMLRRPSENMENDIIFHKLNSPLAPQLQEWYLEIFVTIQLNGPGPHHDIHTSCLDYTT